MCCGGPHLLPPEAYCQTCLCFPMPLPPYSAPLPPPLSAGQPGAAAEAYRQAAALAAKEGGGAAPYAEGLKQAEEVRARGLL